MRLPKGPSQLRSISALNLERCEAENEFTILGRISLPRLLFRGPVRRPCSRTPSSDIRVRKQNVAHHAVEIVAGGDELAKGPARRTKCIEFFDGKASFRAGTAKIRESPRKFLLDLLTDRLVDSRSNFDVARIESDLPRIGR